MSFEYLMTRSRGLSGWEMYNSSVHSCVYHFVIHIKNSILFSLSRT